MKAVYELETGPLAMYVYRGKHEEAAAFALTHGGWSICRMTSDGYLRVAGNENWSRAEAVRWLQANFPGLEEVA